MQNVICEVLENGIFPEKATDGAAAYDLFASKSLYLKCAQTHKVPVGIKLEIPNGCYAQILPRSGLAINGISIANSPGLIDSDYRGEIMVLMNYSLYIQSKLVYEPFQIEKGDRIAQLLLSHDNILINGKVKDNTKRGTKGFGSTGVSKDSAHICEDTTISRLKKAVIKIEEIRNLCCDTHEIRKPLLNELIQEIENLAGIAKKQDR